MDEIANTSTDMSAEDLLRDVLKFDEESTKEEKSGTAFAIGALEKAKELMREQNARIQMKEALREGTEDKAQPTKERVVSKEEEELKRIFAAGESYAESRISFASSQQQTQIDIDELIEQDTTVPRNARSIDDELTELEMRIAKTTSVDADGPNPMFDVFSGPEVYNPNVDPLNAVNWPGAKPGSKQDVTKRLPTELKAAVEKATFAARMISQLEEDDNGKYSIKGKPIPDKQVYTLQSIVKEAVEIGLIPDPEVIEQDRARLSIVLRELNALPSGDMFEEIASNFNDLLLSDHFIDLVKERLRDMADRDLDARRKRDVSGEYTEEDVLEMEKCHEREREDLSRLISYAQLLLKEVRALGAELEASQLEIVRSICQVAMDPKHTTEEETAMALTDAVADMRPLLDDSFVAYLKYAIAEEEGRLARAGLLDDQEESRWLFVLKIVQEGVYRELAKSVNRYLEHIWYILRMETRKERRELLEKLVDVMPTMDVRPFVKVVDNIVSTLGTAAKGDFNDGVMEIGKLTNKLLQLKRDMEEVLPPERIREMSKDADEWAARQKERLAKQRKMATQRLKGSAVDDIERPGRRGEVERFD
mmetsp:Transcript_36312/g.53189  ORF Transcript_36312/g.53189 Transcript_36312/m.53189 type:complete len:593 (-) Transcript_36312:237-2015(-)